MTTDKKITIADALAITDILTDGSFHYTKVLDMRCCKMGNARPIEEATLKRLQNHFIGYDQVPTCFDQMDDEKHQSVCEEINACSGETLLITDEVAKAAKFCKTNSIPFISKTLYVVETGKGNIIHDAQPQQQQASMGRFGTFGG